MKFVDTHAHLDFSAFDSDREELLTKLATEDFGVITIATDLESIAKVNHLSQTYPHVWGALGLHPSDVSTENLTKIPEALHEWEQLFVTNSKLVAVGEIGLDYFRDKTAQTAERQQVVLRELLTFAQSIDKPVVIHSRDAYGDLAILLGDYPKTRGVIHCFNGSKTEAEKFLDLGFYLSFTAIVTYPANHELREIARYVPSNRYMLETDSPFLPPQERRGTRNDPFTIKEIAQCLAETRGESVEQIAAETTQNAVALFNLH